MRSDLCRFGNLIAFSRREARRIITEVGEARRHRLSLVGERLIAQFQDIDAGTTLDERLALIGANPADASDIEPGRDSMLHLVWARSLEWSAMRRRDKWIEEERASLYWAVAYVMLDWMGTDEVRPAVDAALRMALPSCGFPQLRG
ncbi:hypothetical protein [Burkholderia sp. NRF60-BP8]|uniref:hypothetical protein n=1 Tax=Burkholderia sp. NRF60-BP8 TaxID=1637853 RepID=UPI00076C368C|nr:hypothetical protein [Burkholderia sp. NRF60-BP8]AOI78025.1 hypothetical protein WS54_16910 [Burkholderia sp. NRF60-BP8]KVA18054.1 hypothetical protein WS54_05585 [Burkholderia sp. NRF60-BP8]